MSETIKVRVRLMDGPRFVMRLAGTQTYGGAWTNVRWIISDRKGIIQNLELANVRDAEFVLKALNSRLAIDRSVAPVITKEKHDEEVK